MYQAFQKAGQPVKLVLHQNGHNVPYHYRSVGNQLMKLSC